MHRTLLCLTADEEGATAIEYALIVALVCLAGLVGVAALGSTVSGSLYGSVSSLFGGVANNAATNLGP